MIVSVRLCINHSSKVRKLDLDNPRLYFKPGYNAIIGPNGSGKSTVLKALATCSMCVVEKTSDNDDIKYVTTETLNPLAGGSFSSRDSMIQGIRAMFQSHGQGVMDSLRSQCHASETIVLIDSPETGQDHANSVLIHQGLVKMAKRFQVIAATNSLIFMQGGNIIDLGQRTLPRLLKVTTNLVGTFTSHGLNVRTPHKAPKKR